MQPFVSHDGQRSNGERAEVRVQISTGTVANIDLNDDTGNAQVTFKVENLKFPPKGWTNKREPAYTLIEQAKASGDTIDFRIESQRKGHVDIGTPIEELLKNEPGKNIRSIIAGVRHDPNNDWTLTSEAVTDPEEDPVSAGGRHSAIGRNRKQQSESDGGSITPETAVERLRAAVASESFTGDVIANLVAQTLLAGAEIDVVHAAVAGNDRRVRDQPAPRATIAREAPGWKDWNNDGRPNLGRLDVQATAGVEKFVREIIVGDGPAFQDIEDRVRYYTRVLLAVADLVQTRAYGEGFKADRGASSHSIIRGIIYDTVDHYEPLPLAANTRGDIDAWIGRVGKLVTTRFEIAIREADETYTLRDIPHPNFITDGNKTPPAASVETATATRDEHAVPTEPAPGPSAAETDSPAVADDVPATPVETLTATATPVAESELVEPAAQPEINDDEESGAVLAADIADEPAGEDVETPVVEDPQAPQPAADDTVDDDTVDDDTVDDDAVDDDAVDDDAVDDDESPYMFTPPEGQLDEELLDENGNLDPSIAPDKDVTDDFKALVAAAGLDREGLRKLVALLENTFGPKFGKIANIPADALDEFIQFYAATGGENFKRAVESMP